MPGFRIVVHRIQTINQSPIRHCHVYFQRGENWDICGILTMPVEAWNRLQVLCAVVAIEIQDHAAISS